MIDPKKWYYETHESKISLLRTSKKFIRNGRKITPVVYNDHDERDGYGNIIYGYYFKYQREQPPVNPPLAANPMDYDNIERREMK